jgi:hypothetical protein
MGVLPPFSPEEEPQRQTITMQLGQWRQLSAMAKDESMPKRRFSRHGLIVFILETALKQQQESKARSGER